jgi:hypothetical protein
MLWLQPGPSPCCTLVYSLYTETVDWREGEPEETEHRRLESI